MWFVNANKDGNFAKFKVENNEDFYTLVKILDANGYDIICCRDKNKREEE